MKPLNYNKWIKRQELYREKQTINQHLESERKDLDEFIDNLIKEMK